MSEANVVLPQLTAAEWKILWSVLGSALVALAYGFFMVWKVLSCDPGNAAMQREGQKPLKTAPWGGGRISDDKSKSCGCLFSLSSSVST